MRKLYTKRSIIYSTAILLIISIFFTAMTHDRAFAEETDQSERISFQFIEPFYNEVLKKWQDEEIPFGNDFIEVEANNYSEISDDALSVTNYAGENQVLLWQEAFGWVEYEIEVDHAGLYEIAVEYLPLKHDDGGSRQSVILNVMVNDEVPYREARAIELKRYFKDQEDKFDEEGNQIRSLIDETTTWNKAFIRDPGVSVAPLKFNFKKGKNTIRIQPQREQLALKKLTVQSPSEYPNYQEVKDNYPKQKSNVDKPIMIEAEDFKEKSSTSIQVQYNRDPLTTPKSLKNVKFNTLGGSSWHKGGQSVTWEFEVPEDGLYNIGFRTLQNYRKSLSTFRSIYINDEIPFKELKNYRIPYETKWQGVTLQDENESPYSIYLEKGTNTITFETTYEPFVPIIVQMEQLSNEIKEITEELRFATGFQEDEFRVWNVEKELPGLLERLESMEVEFTKLANELIEINGERSNVSQSFESIADDIATLLKKPNMIPNNQVKISALQEQLETQRTELMENPLEIDKFYVVPQDEEFPRMTANIFERLQGTFNSLVYSFSDQNQLREQKDEELNIWMMWGRDYAEELQQLANQYFTPEHGVKVNVNLIQDQNLLILAKAAGIMPDVALGVPSGMPFEMALRGAAKNLRELPDADQLFSQYAPGSLLPYYYNGNYYGIPETINFKILFYRKDILSRLDLDVPETWEEVYDMIPTLLQNQYNFYADPKDFSYMLYQSGAELYTEDGLASALDQPEAFQGFVEWTNLFNLHGLDNQVQSFYQQFRNGTMPIGVADFNQYMQILVAAPEILDSWEIAPVPGHVNDKGEIVRWAGGTGMDTTSIMLFNDTPEEKQELAWEFIKWYTSTEIQTEYGLNLEQFRGETFRWNSANIHAFSNMPWRPQDLHAILEQWQWVKDVPNVPGSYMTTRQLDFSWNETVLENTNPRIQLENAVKDINRELRRKQIEFDIIDGEGNVIEPIEMLEVVEPWEGVKEVEKPYRSR